MATKNRPNTRTARVPQRPVVIDAAHCWMERTNPLIGVSIRTAQNIFDAARNGDTQRLHWLFHEIEAANPILFTCIDRRIAVLYHKQHLLTRVQSVNVNAARYDQRLRLCSDSMFFLISIVFLLSQKSR